MSQSNLDDLLETKSQPNNSLTSPQSSQPQPTQNATPEEIEITYSPARTNNYQAIRGMASVFDLLSWASGLGGALSALGAWNAYSHWGIVLDVYLLILFFVIGLIFAFVFRFLAESISVIVDIEANSRQTAKTLEKLLRSQ